MTETLLLDQAAHAALAERLLAAHDAGRGIEPPSATLRYTLADAYRVRRRFVDLLVARGDPVIGHKVGFTAPAMRAMYGMDQPDFGQLLRSMILPAGTPIRVTGRADTRAEPEIAFRLARPLAGPGVGIEDVLDATESVCGAVEVIDSRVGAMRAAGVDSVADNAGAGLVVLGETALPPRAVDLVALSMVFTIDGEVQSGRSGEVMGHPAAAVAWLANRLAELDGLGGTLEAGHIVIPGSPLRSVAVHGGSSGRADFGPLGAFDLAFV